MRLVRLMGAVGAVGLAGLMRPTELAGFVNWSSANGQEIRYLLK
ncbi:hypothetical protein [Paenibacillus fonticola]|nr:hypothetical protein [Paenibacillus fonticola]